MKIGFQFFLSMLLVVGVAVYHLVDFIFRELKPTYREAIEETQIDATYLLAGYLQNQYSDNQIHTEGLSAMIDAAIHIPLRAEVYALTKTTVDLRVLVIDTSGKIIFHSKDKSAIGAEYSNWRDFILTMSGEYGARSTKDDPQDPNSSVLYVSAPIIHEGRIVGVLTTGKPTKSANFFLEAARARMLKASLSTLVAVLFASLILSLLVTRPIRRLTAYARALGKDEKAQFPRLGKSEIADLGNAFEEMRKTLEGKAYVEQYIQTLTHELKSPLSAISGAAELLSEPNMCLSDREKFLTNIQTEANRMKILIDRLLELAALEKRQHLEEIEKITLEPMLEEILTSFIARINQKSLTVRWEKREICVTLGERFYLRQAFANIIANAIDFSPMGGTITLSLESQRVGDGRKVSIIQIQDEGPGIPDYAKARVCERFFSLPRPETERKSSGIGLAFVLEVIKLHRGELTFFDGPIKEHSQDQSIQRGTVVRVELPA